MAAVPECCDCRTRQGYGRYPRRELSHSPRIDGLEKNQKSEKTAG